MVGNDKRVLELGSGPGAVTRLLTDNACRVTALELDQKAIELVTPFCERVYPCNLNDPSWPGILANSEKFEVIVAADVLEHLYDPWKTLSFLPPLLAKDGYAVISLPHAGHSAVIGCLIEGDLEYQPWGLLDKTHIRFFAIKNIQRLFDDAGFKIVDVDFVVKTPEQTEFARRWRRLPAETRRVLASGTFGVVYQVVVKAVPQSATGKALKLASLPIPAASTGSFSGRARQSRALGYAVSFLSLKTRDRIARALRWIGVKV